MKLTLEDIAKITGIVANIAGVILLYLVLQQVQIAAKALDFSKKNQSEANDKSQKEFGINTLLSYSNNSDKVDTGLSCILFIADMTDIEFKKIINYQEIDISPSHIDQLRGCLAGQKESDLFDKKNKHLTNMGSYYVRYKFLSTLNILETYAIASCNKLFDTKMFDMIFNNLRQIKNFKTAITRIREDVGEQGFGYLYEYITNKDNSCSAPAR